MKHLFAAFVIASVFWGLPAQARDTAGHYDIQQVLNSTRAEGVLLPEIRLYFGGQAHSTPKKVFSVVTTNKKTNAFGKSDQEACEWVFLSAIKELQYRAQREGHNAVVGITSYYKKRHFSSEKDFECGAGAIIAGVALKGKVVTL